MQCSKLAARFTFQRQRARCAPHVSARQKQAQQSTSQVCVGLQLSAARTQHCMHMLQRNTNGSRSIPVAGWPGRKQTHRR
jgi:hypothetical protein